MIEKVPANPLSQPNPSRVRYMGECFSIPTLSLSEAERRVYHNHAPPGRVALSYLRHDRTSGSLRRFASDFASWRHPRFAWEAAACRVTTGGEIPVLSAGLIGACRSIGEN